MKLIKSFFALVFSALVVWLVFVNVHAQDTNLFDVTLSQSGQTNLGTTNALAPFNPIVGSLPSTKEEIGKWIISLVTPFIVWLFSLIPKDKLPRKFLPLMTPVLGIGLGYGLHFLAGLNLGWVDMAQAGTVAVMIRESVNQCITKYFNGEKDSEKVTPSTPPS